jgi:hypothetical protein
VAVENYNITAAIDHPCEIALVEWLQAWGMGSFQKDIHLAVHWDIGRRPHRLKKAMNHGCIEKEFKLD